MDGKKKEKKPWTISQLVSFKLGDEEYALDIMKVQEVIHLIDIMPVPQVPGFVKGVINVRGDIMPVFDLRIKFDLALYDFTQKARIIVAMLGNEKVSFLVDEIFETIRIEESQVDPAPSVKMKIHKECILGLGELENKMIIILNIDEIHREIKEEIIRFGEQWRKRKQAALDI